MGRKAIELNPTDPVPLVAVASALVMDTRETDMDRDARYAEASKDAQAALDDVDTGLQIPPNVPPNVWHWPKPIFAPLRMTRWASSR